MSLPRFLRGLQKKPTIPIHPDPNLSDSSSSSSSTGPKDALGFPIPVSSVITLATANNSNNQLGPTDNGASHCRLSATSTVSSSSVAKEGGSSLNTPSITVISPSHTTIEGSESTTSDNNNSSNSSEVKNRSSRSSSVSSVESSSFHDHHHFRPAGSTITTATTTTTTKDNPQLLSKSFPLTSQFLSPSVPPSLTTLPSIPILNLTATSTAVSTPLVNLTSPSQTRPPQVIYPSSTIPGSSSPSSSVTNTTTTSTSTTAGDIATATTKPTKTTMGFDIVVSYIEDQSDPELSGSGSNSSSKRNSCSTMSTSEIVGIGGVDQITKKQEQLTETEGVKGKTGRIRSNAIAQHQLQPQPHHQQQKHQHPLGGDDHQSKSTSAASSSSSSSLTSLSSSSFLTNTSLDGELAVAGTAAVIQHGPRRSSNSDLEPPETLARNLVGASVIVQERVAPQLKQVNHNSSSSSGIIKSTATSSTRTRSLSTPQLVALASSTTPATSTSATAFSSSPSPSPSSILSSSSFSSSATGGSGSNLTAASRPVSILKHGTTQPLPPQGQQRPKSILRSRSGSHPLLPVPSSRPPSMSISEPHSPQHSPTKSTFPSTSRLSITSDTSSLSRSSSFLQQDPMEQQPSPIIGATSVTSTSLTGVKSGSRGGSTSLTHRRLSAKDLEGPRSANSSPSSLPSEISRPRILPPNPSSTTQHMRADYDEYDNNDNNNNNASKRRHLPQDNLDPTLAPGSTNRLSFPSLSNYPASTSAPSTTTATAAMATPLVATVPPENYTPLTLKSVRAAKSRNKLRQQESQIGVATGIRRNSLPKSALTTTTMSSGGNEGSTIAGLASSTPPPPVNHLPPLPTTPSPSNINNNLSDYSPEMSALLNASPGRRRATSPSILSPLHSLPTDPSPSLSSSPSAVASSSRRRESSTASTSGLVHIPIIMPRPILKDTSARDKMRESWMSEVPGITISGTTLAPGSSGGSNRSVIGSSPSPVAPPKSLARTNSASAKRQSKANRHSATTTAAEQYDQDALTPRPRQGSSGYGPDYRPRRQSGGPGHLLFTFDVSASSSAADFESEEYEDSEIDDREELYSKHLQEQYTRLQQSQLRQSSMDGGSALSAAVITAGSRLPSSSTDGEDNIPYLSKRGQRKSLGDELDVPPVPEKSMQRKRVSTMGATTLPAMSTSLVSVLSAANNNVSSASETLSSIIRSNTTTGHQQKLKGPYGGGAIGGALGGGSIGGNSLSFEPLFALKDSPSDSNSRRVGGGDSKLLQQEGALGSRLSEVSDADWYTALLTIDPNQQGVSIMDLSKRGLTEVPSGLPSTITHLRLAYNLVQILAPIASLTALHHLQVLDLCDNQLEILPPELGLLTRLKELYLSNNKLYKLPDTIQRMARLEVLDVRNNQFYLLNPVVGRLKALRQLDVRHNQLKSLPPLLYMLSTTLTLLLVDGNQFVQPFSDLLQPLMSGDDTESQASISARQSYLGDDPYGESGNNNSGRKMSTGGIYEPWRRSVGPVQPRRGNNGGGIPVLVKRRSHGDLMTLMGLQKRDGNASTDDLLNSAAVLDYNSNKSHTISTSSGAYIAASMGSDGSATATAAATRRERSVSTSNLTPVGEIHSVITLPSASNSNASSPHPLSFNKLFKSMRKSSKASSKENNPAILVSAKINDPKRYSLGSEADTSVGDLELEASAHPQEPTESKPNSRGSNHGINRRATSGGINKWVKDRFHKRTNSNELSNLQANNASMTSLHSNHGGALDLLDGQHPVRDSGYGAVGGSSSTPTPEPGASASTRIIGNRHQNKSTGHLPSGSPFASRDGTHQLSSSFDPSQRKERDYRYSYMSMESQVTQGTEADSEAMDLDALSQQQQHRMSSVHSPTTPLPSSPIMGLSSNHSAGPNNNWNAATPRYGQSAAHIKPLMQYLKDLHDLDPDSSEWEEVYAWRRVWNAERAAPAGLGGSNVNTQSSSQSNKDSDETMDEATTDQAQQDQLAKSEEVRLAKLQAQASRRRRIVEEIMTTERTYVEGLKGLVEIYLTPALQVMPPGDHKAVFSNAQAIYTFHANHFLPELEKAFKISQSEAAAAAAAKDNLAAQLMSPVSPVPTSSSQFLSDPSAPSSAASSSAASVLDNGSKQGSDVSAISNQQQGESNRDSQALSESSVTSAPTTPAASAATAIKLTVEDRIGRVFAEHVAYMKMYSFYINNFDNALRVLQTQLTQAKHKKKMKEFLRRCAKHPNHTQLALQGYLLLPVQRIPRYKMLLQDLLENTWVDHVDYQDIATALEKISTRADEMNERKRQYENHEKVLLVQNRIIGQYKTPLVQPHRKVVREGMLHLIRVVTRNVSMMGLDNKSSSSLVATAAAAAAPAPSVPMGDMTVHHLSEETVEKSFLFILFNDIMIQCNPITGKSNSGGSGSLGGSLAAMNGSSATLSSSAGAPFSNGGGSNGAGASGASGGAGGDGANGVAKNLELQRVLQLESRLHPAEVIGNDVLRVVDDAMVLYLTGDKDVIQAWKEDINSRW